MYLPKQRARWRIFLAAYLLVLTALCLTGGKLLLLHQEQERGEELYDTLRLEHTRPGTPVAVPGKNQQFPQQVLPTQVQDLRNLQAQYSELTAWIEIPGTPVDYPVMQSGDNVKYLDHMPDGTKNTIGSIFLDMHCTTESPHVLLYGHNVGRGTMFGSLKRYREEGYYQQHPTMTLVTRERVYTCTIFSVHPVSAYDGEIYRTAFEDERQFAAFVERCQAASLYEIPAQAGPEDRVLTLSTCTGGEKTTRFVVHAYIGAADPLT